MITEKNDFDFICHAKLLQIFVRHCGDLASIRIGIEDHGGVAARKKKVNAAGEGAVKGEQDFRADVGVLRRVL